MSGFLDGVLLSFCRRFCEESDGFRAAFLVLF